MARIQVPLERISFGANKEGKISIIDSQISTIDMDENAPAKCDLCSVPLGSIKEVKHWASPETISNAVKKGYTPHKMLKIFRDILVASGEKNPSELIEAGIAAWKEVVDKGETPWALCEECHKEIQSL